MKPEYPLVLSESGGALSPYQMKRAGRVKAKTELAVFRHALAARAQSEMDRLDSQAVADASRTALEEELDLLDYGLARAGQSAAKVELVARHVEQLAAINNRRIARRFGA
jgi:hypothetical protein